MGTRTFTIAAVDGRIRGLRVECDETDARLDYEEALDWTIPPPLVAEHCLNIIEGISKPSRLRGPPFGARALACSTV